MKESIAGAALAAVSAIFFINGEPTEREAVYAPIPEIPTTEQLIEKTDLYKRVHILEQTLDSLNHEKINSRPSTIALWKVQ